ncbi:hypothetical protein HYH02_014054 [Chlamydomonas schloesseri]|uniref:Cytochrome b561 domain-containing protein n=1 Tax=Chlamydomonas schloesseri TaxID=2026947 RepID=A0A835SLR2_9CHLO|nr:hypothetical protein HYH02_014054 [Chlamydomonas schloesseri]|eukprot:KAG2429398.1 hypothetical protein HYH02_014054 [Chlamydomonas schloesseri]
MPGATSMTFKATTATSRWGSFLQGSTTLPISASCGCTSSSPAPASAAASASPSPKPSPSASSGPLPPTASTPSPSPAASSSGSSSDTSSSSSSSRSSSGSSTDSASASTAAATTCAPSTLGYACSLALPGGGGEALHWTAGTAAPPDNACTRSSSSSSSATSTSATASSTATANLVHFALSSPQSGYLSIGFTQRAGMMAPANAVIGRIASGSATVETYYMTSYDLDPPTNNGWAAGAAVLSTSAGGTVLCFTVAADGAAAAAAAASGHRRRQLSTAAATAATMPRRSLAATTTTTTTTTSTTTAAAAAASSSITNALGLNAAALELIWASHRSADLTATHSRWGGVSLNGLSGAAAASAASRRRDQMLALHGALAAAGWVLLVPLGLLLARHRRNVSALRRAPRVVVVAGASWDMWLALHVGCVFLGTASGAASIGVAAAELRGSGASDGSTLAHRVTGWAVLGLAVLQMLSGGIRPAPGASRRRLWTLLHANLGRAAALLAWSCTGLGVFLAVTRYSQDLTAWAAPLAATLALLLGAELGLTAAAALVAEAAYAAAPPPPPPGPDALAALLPPAPAPGLPVVGYPASAVNGALPSSQQQMQMQMPVQQQQQQQQQQRYQGVYVLPAAAAASTGTASANQMAQMVCGNGGGGGGGGGGSSRHQLFQPYQQPYHYQQEVTALPPITATGAASGATADGTVTTRPPSSSRQAQAAPRPPSAAGAAPAPAASSASSSASGGGAVQLGPLRRQQSPPSLGDSGYGDGALGLRGNKK